MTALANDRFLPPANEVCEGDVFTGVCRSTPGGGACMVLFGGRVWFYSGGVHGFIWGACMVLFGGGGGWACVVFSVFSDERAVRILLECILVLFLCSLIFIAF